MTADVVTTRNVSEDFVDRQGRILSNIGRMQGGGGLTDQTTQLLGSLLQRSSSGSGGNGSSSLPSSLQPVPEASETDRTLLEYNYSRRTLQLTSASIGNGLFKGAPSRSIKSARTSALAPLSDDPSHRPTSAASSSGRPLSAAKRMYGRGPTRAVNSPPAFSNTGDNLLLSLPQSSLMEGVFSSSTKRGVAGSYTAGFRPTSHSATTPTGNMSKSRVARTASYTRSGSLPTPSAPPLRLQTQLPPRSPPVKGASAVADPRNSMFGLSAPLDPGVKLLVQETLRKTHGLLGDLGMGSSDALGSTGGTTRRRLGSGGTQRSHSASRAPLLASRTVGSVNELGAAYRPTTVAGYCEPEQCLVLPGAHDSRWRYTRLSSTVVNKLYDALAASPPGRPTFTRPSSAPSGPVFAASDLTWGADEPPPAPVEVTETLAFERLSRLAVGSDFPVHSSSDATAAALAADAPTPPAPPPARLSSRRRPSFGVERDGERDSDDDDGDILGVMLASPSARAELAAAARPDFNAEEAEQSAAAVDGVQEDSEAVINKDAGDRVLEDGEAEASDTLPVDLHESDAEAADVAAEMAGERAPDTEAAEAVSTEVDPTLANEPEAIELPADEEIEGASMVADAIVSGEEAVATPDTVDNTGDAVLADADDSNILIAEPSQEDMGELTSEPPIPPSTAEVEVASPTADDADADVPPVPDDDDASAEEAHVESNTSFVVGAPTTDDDTPATSAANGDDGDGDGPRGDVTFSSGTTPASSAAALLTPRVSPPRDSDALGALHGNQGGVGAANNRRYSDFMFDSSVTSSLDDESGASTARKEDSGGSGSGSAGGGGSSDAAVADFFTFSIGGASRPAASHGNSGGGSSGGGARRPTSARPRSGMAPPSATAAAQPLTPEADPREEGSDSSGGAAGSGSSSGRRPGSGGRPMSARPTSARLGPGGGSAAPGLSSMPLIEEAEEAQRESQEYMMTLQEDDEGNEDV